MSASDPISAATVGCLLGTAVGDALGLPYEGLSPRRAARLLGPPDRYRLFGRWGLVSDDTEHTCMVAQSLLASGGDPLRFRRSLAWRLRFWLLGLPAGIGWATLRAILRLWLGWNPERSGVWSAGNGPAMRAAILGAALGDDARLAAFVRASTRLTHTDPLAEAGAFAVALAAGMASAGAPVAPARYLERLRVELDARAAALRERIEQAAAAAQRGETTVQFAASLGLTRGVSGYVNHSIPVALHAWFRHPCDFAAAVQGAIRCGGDTDTAAAIVGGILGAAVGREGIPPEWLDRLREWPRSVGWMTALGVRLADWPDTPATTGRRLDLTVAGRLPRNLVFMLIVLAHGFRRLLPPY